MKYLLTAGLSATLIFGAAAENYVLKKSDDWHPVRFDVTAIEKDSILDFGKALQHHRPAGKYGFIKVAGDHFEFEKLPGKKQRFFGVNICGTANIPSKRDAEIMAEAIARAGYNSVRFHHFDNYVCRKDEGPSTELDPEKIDRMDYLVKQLKERGIYITLDLFCSRYVSKNELPSIWHPVHGWNYKNAVYVSAEAQKNFLEFCRNFMLHRNPYTGLSYAEDPAFLFLNILNENFLGIWRADNAGGLGWIWEDLFTKWCRKKGIPKEKRGGKSLRLNAFLYEFTLQFHEKMVRELRKMGIRQPLTQFNAGTEPILMAIRSKLDVVCASPLGWTTLMKRLV